MAHKISRRGLGIAALFAAGLLSAAAADWPAPADLPPRPEITDPLAMFDGTPVTNKEQWFNKRRPELKELFQHYVYGHLPAPVQVTAAITRVDTNFFAGKATLKLVTLAIGPEPAPHVHLLTVIPNHRRAPAPLFIGMNFSGNHSLVADTNVPLTESWMPDDKRGRVVNHHATAVGRGTEVDTWALEQTIDRGYAVTTYYCGDVEEDRTNAQGGVRELIHKPVLDDDWGTLAAWAWGMSRVVDYTMTDPEVDSKRVALVGHSRFGKATVLAGAMDDRIALIIPLQSGTGGTSPSRGHIGETVKQITKLAPYWFCANFRQFNDAPEKLPVEQNCLVALCAPRPVLLGAAELDTWANPDGAFEMLLKSRAAARLAGADGVGADAKPANNVLIDSNPGYFVRPGRHSMTKADWKVFLDYADKHLRAGTH